MVVDGLRIRRAKDRYHTWVFASCDSLCTFFPPVIIESLVILGYVIVIGRTSSGHRPEESL